jgi:hypothetical protein
MDYEDINIDLDDAIWELDSALESIRALLT